MNPDIYHYVYWMVAAGIHMDYMKFWKKNGREEWDVGREMCDPVVT